MQVTRDRTERPHGALLQFDIECLYHMYRIGRSLRDRDASFEGDVVGDTTPCVMATLTQIGDPYRRQCLTGSLTGAVAS